MVDFTENFSQYAISKLPAFRDDFTIYTDQASADLAWASADITKNRVNIGTDVLDLNILRDNTNDSIVHDLVSTISDSNWVLRFKLTIDTLNLTAFQTQGFFGLFNGDETAGEETVQSSIGVILTAITGTLTYRLFTSEESIITGGASTIFTHALAVETLFVEIKRNSKTSYEVNLYSDANYSTLIESQQGICSAGTIGLRYIGMKNNASMTVGSSILGSMDDVEFWNEAQQGDVTFQDDFTIDNWVDSNANVGVNTGTNVIDFNFNANSTNMKTINDRITTSDTNWTLRFKLNFTSLTQASNSAMFLGLTDGDQTVSSQGNQDFVGLRIDNQVGVTTFGCTRVDNTVVGGQVALDTFTEVWATGVDYFFEIKRLSATDMRCTLFSDADFTQVVGVSNITDLTSAITALQFITVHNIDFINAGTFTGTIDDIEFYDEVSVAKTPIKEFIDFEDNFWENNWTQFGSRIVVNTSTQVVDCDWNRDASQHDVTFDLNSIFPNGVNPNGWGLRFKLKVLTAVTGNNDPRAMVWLTDLPSGASGISFQANASFIIRFDDATGDLDVTGAVDDATTSIAGGTLIIVGTNIFGIGDTIYCEMIRNKNFWTISVYSDPDFTQLLGRGSIDDEGVSTVANLRYLKIGQFISSINIGGAFTGTVDKIQFWNGNNPTEHGTKWVEVNL